MPLSRRPRRTHRLLVTSEIVAGHILIVQPLIAGTVVQDLKRLFSCLFFYMGFSELTCHAADASFREQEFVLLEGLSTPRTKICQSFLIRCVIVRKPLSFHLSLPHSLPPSLPRSLSLSLSVAVSPLCFPYLSLIPPHHYTGFSFFSRLRSHFARLFVCGPPRSAWIRKLQLQIH